MKYWALMLVLLSACYVKHDYSLHPPTTQAACMELFRDINDIQKYRGEAADKMQNYSRALKAGKISKKKHKKKRETWLIHEKTMRAQVTTLYDIGYEYRCF
jgi:hypothetical protein